MVATKPASSQKTLAQTGIIKFLIGLTGKTQAQIAKELGVTPGTLNNIIQGWRSSEPIEKALASRFGVRREALFLKVAA